MKKYNTNILDVLDYAMAHFCLVVLSTNMKKNVNLATNMKNKREFVNQHEQTHVNLSTNMKNKREEVHLHTLAFAPNHQPAVDILSFLLLLSCLFGGFVKHT